MTQRGVILTPGTAGSTRAIERIRVMVQTDDQGAESVVLVIKMRNQAQVERLHGELAPDEPFDPSKPTTTIVD